MAGRYKSRPMKTAIALVVAVVASLSFGGCSPYCPGKKNMLFPALAVNPPYGKFPITKETGIYVQLSREKLPPADAKKAQLYVDGKPQPFDTLIKAEAGKQHWIGFSTIPGYMMVPKMPVKVSEGRTTTAIATYNALPAKTAVARTGVRSKQARIMSVGSLSASSVNAGTIAFTWDYNANDYANGAVDVVWSSSNHPAGTTHWWLIPGGPWYPILASQGSGIQQNVAPGTPYLYFEGVSGWYPPNYPYNYCQVYVARRNKTTVWLWYGQ